MNIKEKTLKKFEQELLDFCSANWVEVSIKPISNIDNIGMSTMKHNLPRPDSGYMFEIVIYTNKFPDRVFLLCREVGRFLGYTLEDLSSSTDMADKYGFLELESFFNKRKISKDMAEEIKKDAIKYLKG